MYAWEQIQQTLDYIEDHIQEPMELDHLAQIAMLSPFYYQRLFRQLVKKPVAEYIRLRRLAIAIERLREQDRRILDIAIELGFTSHEHFTRSFKEAFHMTPSEYRKHPLPISRMTKPELSLHYTMVDEGVPLIINGIVLEIHRKTLTDPINVIGLVKKMPVQFVDGLGTESGVDPLDTLWRDFHKKKYNELHLDPETEEVGITYPCDDPNYFLYLAGAITDHEDTSNKYTKWQVSQGEYIVCRFEAENFETLVMNVLYKAQQYLFGTWLPNHNLRTEPYCIERYASHSIETKSMELWLKLSS